MLTGPTVSASGRLPAASISLQTGAKEPAERYTINHAEPAEAAGRARGLRGAVDLSRSSDVSDAGGDEKLLSQIGDASDLSPCGSAATIWEQNSVGFCVFPEMLLRCAQKASKIRLRRKVADVAEKPLNLKKVFISIPEASSFSAARSAR